MDSIILLLNGCFLVPNRFTSSSGTLNECPNKPQTVLQREKIKSLTLTQQPLKESEIVEKNKAIGYTFAGKSGQVIKYNTQQDICVWIYDPDQQLLSNTELQKDGIYLIQIGVIQGSKAFDLDLSLEILQKSPDLTGVWTGIFANKSTTVDITKQNNDYFEGILLSVDPKLGNSRIAFKGNYISTTNKIIIEETEVLEQPTNTPYPWFLGKNEGKLSSDGISMSGTGQDTKHPSYSWSFSKNNQSLSLNNIQNNTHPAAGEFVRNHYLALNQREYHKTWEELSSKFQQKSISYSKYQKWWNSVQNIKIGNVKLIQQTDHNAIIDAELWYHLNTGRELKDNKNRIYLIWDASKRQWLFDNKASP